MYIREVVQNMPDSGLLYSVFVAVKLVHGASHLLNHELNLELQNSLKNVTSPQTIHGKAFRDFGDLMEFHLFGGVSEHFDRNSGQLFSLDDIVVYKYPGAKEDARVAESLLPNFFNIAKIDEDPSCLILPTSPAFFVSASIVF